MRACSPRGWVGGVIPPEGCCCFSGGAGAAGLEDDAGTTVQFLQGQWGAHFFLSSPRHLNFFPLIAAVVTGPNLQLQVPEAGMIPRQEIPSGGFPWWSSG